MQYYEFQNDNALPQHPSRCLSTAGALYQQSPNEQELLVQLRHYSPASKRDALAGLKSIVDRHRAFAEVNFARLAEASLELAVCPDADVRK